MKRESIIESIKEYFKENEELDGYNGYLSDDRYYPMNELNELFSGESNINILQRAFYGYDEETWTTDSSGNKEYGAFNPNRDYFRFNGYGNLVSVDYKDYSAFLNDYAIESMIENRRYIYSISNDEELEKLFDMLDEEDEEEN